ncbi:DUF6545 domain-containing protein [Gordonia sp. CPCC 205515]|uniref:DUF6545 domain-containing protein n=1 Tax=Gordonia sp. CPCC 205515 TaxID=3140791 RepID=UPI003AF3A806
MRNTIPMWLDVSIAVLTLVVVALRLVLMRSPGARWFTFLVACFGGAHLIKMGVTNDLLTSLVDPRAVRVAAQVLTVAAAFVAAAAVRDARTGWAGRKVTQRIVIRMCVVWVIASTTLLCLDVAAGNRHVHIEEASPGLAVAYFAVYAGTILLGDGYALVHVMLALRTHEPRERPPTAIVFTGVLIFVTTGLNSASLLWYAVANALGDIGTAEQLQRDSNGNLFAYFTLGMSAIALLGLVNWSARQRTDSPFGAALRGLPILWEDLTSQVPSVRLEPSVELDRDESIVRMVTECLDALLLLDRPTAAGASKEDISPSEVLRLARLVDPESPSRGLEAGDCRDR